jgi:hypothetical protein
VKVTNKLNLPPYLFDWIADDQYQHSTDLFTMSATSLMKPVKASVLTSRYDDQLEIDVSELIAAKLGTSIHDSIEKITTPNVTKEQRTTRTIQIEDTTYTVSGKYDVLVFKDDKWILRDIKTTSVWAYILGGKDEEYRKQLSIYRWLLSTRHNVDETAYIDFIFTDWQSSAARNDRDYPQQRIKAGYKIELLSFEDTEKYIKERLTLYHKYRNVPDKELPPCTRTELWASADSFAVMKAGNKRATKVCSSKEEAELYIRDKQVTQSFVEFRQGKIKRCRYCSCFAKCDQFTSYLAQGLIDL